jgi:hypothetical protein
MGHVVWSLLAHAAFAATIAAVIVAESEFVIFTTQLPPSAFTTLVQRI